VSHQYFHPHFYFHSMKQTKCSIILFQHNLKIASLTTILRYYLIPIWHNFYSNKTYFLESLRKKKYGAMCFSHKKEEIQRAMMDKSWVHISYVVKDIIMMMVEEAPIWVFDFWHNKSESGEKKAMDLFLHPFCHTSSKPHSTHHFFHVLN